MKWKPDGWKNPGDEAEGFSEGDLAFANGFAAGADAMLEAVAPLLEQVFAQLCGIRMREGKTDWYSGLDDSIDRLRAIIRLDNKD